MPGCLIAFEGTEGSGKTSQLRRARAWLEGHLDLVVTREPGGTPTAESIRAIVLSRTDRDRVPSTDAFLMSAARHDHVRRVIEPALERGALVLTDRFAASTIAYQGAGDGVAVELLAALHRLATGGREPHGYLLFDVDVERGLARRFQAGELNAMDQRDVAFHRRVREGYLEQARYSPSTWTVIEAGGDEEAVWPHVKTAISTALQACGMDIPA